MSRQIFIIILLIACLSISASAELNFVKFDAHSMAVQINVENRDATIIDIVKGNFKEGLNYFLINNTAEIFDFKINATDIEFQTVKPTDSTYQYYQTLSTLEEFTPDSKAMAVIFTHKNPKAIDTLVIQFFAKFNDNVENARFSNENVGREVSGTISEKGAYLSPSAYYYPRGSESEAMFSVTAIIPKSWQAVSDGDLVLSKSVDTLKNYQSFLNNFKMDGLMFMAAPYKVDSTEVAGIKIYTYFFPEDSALSEDYLSATTRYMTMYNELIGPYPYKQFTVAENFFPTGYGMPAWTLLGQQVIRLPFIKHTSLGHEVLHNWWGNSVYVNYDKGNWCEGLTVYGADYRYKLLKSESDAKDYRKNILKQYVSYINEGNDFPIREFKSRTSAGTRTIGYNKVMMVFHFIENWIGTKPFFDAWKYVYKTYAGQTVSWEDWIAAFEKTSGDDLSFIIPQWIDRTGAPEIGALVLVGYDMTGTSIPLRITQNQDGLYNLKIPVTAYDIDGTQYDTVFFMDEKEKDFFINADFNVSSIIIDPGYTLFRKLYPEEVEPIVSGVLGNEDNHVVAFDKNENYLLFAQNILNDTTAVVKSKSALMEMPTTASPIIINPDHLPGFLANRVILTSDSITIAGTTYPKDSHTIILTCDKSLGFKKGMVVITSDPASMPRIGTLVPHYGKYSYLVFSGPKNVGKGQWEIDSSPLRLDLSASEK